MSARLIITFFFFFFALGSFALFWQNQKESAPGLGKDWWAIAFTEPENPTSADFRIENYTDSEDFRYRVLHGPTTFEEHSLAIPTDQARVVSVTLPVSANLVIEVIHGNEQKNIYRK